MYEIRKNTGMPGKNSEVYPFDSMSINDSFVVPKEEFNSHEEMLVKRNGILQASRAARLSSAGKKFATRITNEGIVVIRIK